MYIDRRVYIRISDKLGGVIELDPEEVKQLQTELGTPPSGQIDWRILSLMGKKIDAIKAIRELRSLGLREAKDTVEEFERRMSVVTDDCIEEARYKIANPEGLPAYPETAQS